MITKGIVLAGGSGTRLYPLTAGICKQLLPVYDKPLVYYPLTTLMLAGIRNILVITTPRDRPQFEAMLGTGEQWGIHLQYAIQPYPQGVADALRVGANFIQGEGVALILGDNIFYGEGLAHVLNRSVQLTEGAKVFAYYVNNPEQYCVIELAPTGQPLRLEEKPSQPRSAYSVPGLYFYDAQAVELMQHVQPSARGELEITTLNQLYLAQNQLAVEILGRGIAWLDAGTPDSLLEASTFVATIEHRQGLKIACPEEVAYRLGWITAQQLEAFAEQWAKTAYGQYLFTVLSAERRYFSFRDEARWQQAQESPETN